MGTQTEQIII